MCSKFQDPLSRFLPVWLALLVLFSVPPVHAASEAAHRPNIVLVLADDLGYGDVGINGATAIRTPNLDRLAREGVRLTQFHASANVCTPSRAGLMTGRYAARAGLSVGVLFPHSEYGLPASDLTLPEALAAAGYRTSMVGKWHLGTVPGSTPMDAGFQHYFGVPYSANMHPLPLIRDREVVEANTDPALLTQKFTEDGVRYIAASDATPFFLYFALTAPHVPVRPGPAYLGRSKAGRYGDVVEEIDSAVGALRAALEKAGKARDTLVIFTSDNGPWWQGSAGAHRGRKGGTFEGGYAVPFIGWQPGHIPPGTRSDAIAMNIDLFPTLLARAGVPLPQEVTLDGRDISALLRGAKTSPHERLVFFANDKVAAVREQQWRYVVQGFYQVYDLPLAIPDLGGELLFDLRTDPQEHYDVSDRYPETAARLQAAIEHAKAEFSAIEQRRTEPKIALPVPGPAAAP
jgi:uncharacterized sulfatase